MFSWCSKMRLVVPVINLSSVLQVRNRVYKGALSYSLQVCFLFRFNGYLARKFRSGKANYIWSVSLFSITV